MQTLTDRMGDDMRLRGFARTTQQAYRGAVVRRIPSRTGTAVSSGRSTLSATLRSCRRSRASHTVAMPPAPSSRSRT